jgi:hypothetical protein
MDACTTVPTCYKQGHCHQRKALALHVVEFLSASEFGSSGTMGAKQGHGVLVEIAPTLAP